MLFFRCIWKHELHVEGSWIVIVFFFFFFCHKCIILWLHKCSKKMCNPDGLFFLLYIFPLPFFIYMLSSHPSQTSPISTQLHFLSGFFQETESEGCMMSFLSLNEMEQNRLCNLFNDCSCSNFLGFDFLQCSLIFGFLSGSQVCYLAWFQWAGYIFLFS